MKAKYGARIAALCGGVCAAAELRHVAALQAVLRHWPQYGVSICIVIIVLRRRHHVGGCAKLRRTEQGWQGRWGAGGAGR
jgi:hypothetical protein